MAHTDKLTVEHLSAWFGREQVLSDISLNLAEHSITAIIGPSGCGKTTFVRCLNRMHELAEGSRSTGVVKLDGRDVYALTVEPAELRRRVGMVFQTPNPFPTMSIRENVLAGFKLTGRRPGPNAAELVEHALEQAGLFDEVKDRLGASGASLSSGQQQRLCIARAIAVDPDVLLMDEPCSALDPVATARVEDLLYGLKDRYTIVIVTHNMWQAARVSQRTAFFLDGTLIEYADTDVLFTAPGDRRTEDYITGKFG
ncbi:MAG: phosphate transport system ATP-binding protein [Myxococcota bacterium]|jgi:phosphate transport system ATP-binding protein